jgi:rhodanese-related sulfurtransferase
LLIICRLGRRSEQAAVILKDIGLKEIFILQGGLIDYYMS